MIAGVVVLHIWALHVPGSNNPAGVEPKTEKDTLPFHPYFTAKDGFALACFLVFYCWFVFYIPNYLGHADNYIEANPLKTPPHIVPEWYYLPFYAILRSIPSKLGGFLAMFGAVLILAALPWLDTRRSNPPPIVRCSASSSGYSSSTPCCSAISARNPPKAATSSPDASSPPIISSTSW